MGEWLASWLGEWLGGWLVGKLAGLHFFRFSFVDSSTKMDATLFALTSNPRVLGWMADLAGWLAGFAGCLAGWLPGWLAGGLAGWLSGWLAYASFGIFCQRFYKNGKLMKEPMQVLGSLISWLVLSPQGNRSQ